MLLAKVASQLAYSRLRPNLDEVIRHFVRVFVADVSSVPENSSKIGSTRFVESL